MDKSWQVGGKCVSSSYLQVMGALLDLTRLSPPPREPTNAWGRSEDGQRTVNLPSESERYKISKLRAAIKRCRKKLHFIFSFRPWLNMEIRPANLPGQIYSIVSWLPPIPPGLINLLFVDWAAIGIAAPASTLNADSSTQQVNIDSKIEYPRTWAWGCNHDERMHVGSWNMKELCGIYL